MTIDELNYLKNPKLCEYCKNIIPFRKRFNKCCSRSCACSISNITRKKHKIKTKIKIANSLKENLLKTNKYITYKDAIKNNLILNTYNICDNNILNRTISFSKINNHTCNCKICNKLIIPILTKSYKLSRSHTCSDNCLKKLKSLKSKESINKIIKENRFCGWQSRNILSYAEKFWIEVLKNNNIEYIPNKPIKQKNGISNYFLDFYIEKNGKIIDLEIDGKQHEYKERKESDIKRDEYIKSLGIFVYRIKWNKITSDKGKQEMKNKIDKFLEFYNNL